MPKPKTNEEIIAALKANPAYVHIDIDLEINKADAWCMVNNRRNTPRFFINWLNRIDPPLKPYRRDVPKSREQVITYKCPECFDAGEISQPVPEDRRQFPSQIEFIPCPSCQSEPPA